MLRYPPPSIKGKNMTLSALDPVCFGQYPAGEEPLLIHFQYEGSEDVFRYALVDRIPISEINPTTRRKAGEGPEEEPIRKKYVKKFIGE